MVILNKEKIYTSKDISLIENLMLQGVHACRTPEAVEAAITYANYLSKTGLTYENYPLFIKILEIGNHWVIDALIGDRDPFLFLSSIKPNRQILIASFGLLAERHPGEGKRHDLTLASALQPPVRRHGEIALAAIADARVERREQKQAVHDLRVPQFQHAHERRARAFAPHRVRIVDEEGTCAEHGQCSLRAAAGIEQHVALVGNEDRRLRSFSAGKAFFEEIGKVMHVDDGGLHACDGEPVEHVLDERPPGKRHERLRHAQGQGAHAFAETRGKDHCRLSLRHGFRLQIGREGSLSRGGSSRLYQSRSGASDGCARLRSR